MESINFEVVTYVEKHGKLPTQVALSRAAYRCLIERRARERFSPAKGTILLKELIMPSCRLSVVIDETLDEKVIRLA